MSAFHQRLKMILNLQRSEDCADHTESLGFLIFVHRPIILNSTMRKVSGTSLLVKSGEISAMTLRKGSSVTRLCFTRYDEGSYVGTWHQTVAEGATRYYVGADLLVAGRRQQAQFPERQLS
jgi:hypothetical protein